MGVDVDNSQNGTYTHHTNIWEVIQPYNWPKKWSLISHLLRKAKSKSKA